MEKVYITADEITSVSCDKEFQETSINWYREDDEIEIFTTDITMVTKMKNIMKKSPLAYKCFYYNTDVSEDNRPRGYFFTCDKSLLTFRVPSAKEFSDEQRQQMSDRLRGLTN